jgi:chemotaxis protein methyltransferase WspC
MSAGESRILAVLAARIGLDAQSLGATVIRAAFERRRRACKLADLDAYAARLESDPVELGELTEELVVPETWFFRDRRPFEVLAAFARESRASRRETPFRALSLPCATGDEPYSIAIVLMDQGWPSGSFEVVGVDLSRRSIERAQHAVYDERALRAVAPELRSSYFEPSGPGFTPLATVRKAVRFERGNLLDFRPPAGIEQFDAVFCRNVLIYLTPQARAQCFATLDRLLAPGGLLVLGHAETLPQTSKQYTPVSDLAGFAYRKQSPSAPLLLSALPTIEPARAPAPQPLVAPPPSKPRRGPARPPAPTPAPPTTARPKGGLEEARALANRQEHDQAIAACLRTIAVEGPSAPAYQLLGMIQQAAGRIADAEASLRRAVYLDPEDDDALLALALLAQRRGDVSAHRRYTRQAERVRSKRGGS